MHWHFKILTNNCLLMNSFKLFKKWQSNPALSYQSRNCLFVCIKLFSRLRLSRINIHRSICWTGVGAEEEVALRAWHVTVKLVKEETNRWRHSMSWDSVSMAEKLGVCWLGYTYREDKTVSYGLGKIPYLVLKRVEIWDGEPIILQ